MKFDQRHLQAIAENLTEELIQQKTQQVQAFFRSIGEYDFAADEDRCRRLVEVVLMEC